MKTRPYILFLCMLSVISLPLWLPAQRHDTDSLQMAMQSTSGEWDRLHASVLLARELLPAEPESAGALLESVAALELFGQTVQQVK